MPLRLHASRAPELHTSTSARPLRASRGPELHTSTSVRLQHDSRGPEVPFLHVRTPAARLPSSIPLRLHASRAPELHTSTSASPQDTSRALDSTSMSTHVYRACQSSVPPRLHACSAPLELHHHHLLHAHHL